MHRNKAPEGGTRIYDLFTLDDSVEVDERATIYF
jgi:hypothetical protein